MSLPIEDPRSADKGTIEQIIMRYALQHPPSSGVVQGLMLLQNLRRRPKRATEQIKPERKATEQEKGA